MSGTVTSLGAGVADLAVGDEVIGLIDFDRDGAAAEYVVMPAASLAAKPNSVSHVAAATLPLAALTAGVVAGTHARSGPHGFDELPYRNGTSVSGRSRGWPAARANARQQARWSSLVQTAPASGGLRSARTGKAPPSGPRGMPLGPRVRTDHMSGSSPASRRLAARPQVSRCGQPAAVRRARPLR